MKVDFNIEILNTLLDKNPDKAILLQTKYPKIDQWLHAEDRPTLNQLSTLANIFNIPFGYFFLEEVPEKRFPIPHFRTHNKQPVQPSQELMDIIATLQERQQWAKDILMDLKPKPHHRL